MAEEKGKVVLFGKSWASRATVAEMLVSGELKDCSQEPTDSTGECVTSVGRGWIVIDTMGFGEPLGGIVPDDYVRKMAIDFLNEVKGRYSHIIFMMDRADFPLRSEEVIFPIPIMWRIFLEAFKGGEENFVVLVTDETPDRRMEFKWLTVEEEGLLVQEKEGLERMLERMQMARNRQDMRIKKMFPECKHFLFTNFENLGFEKFLNDGHVVSRIDALERFEKEMEEMFTTTICPSVELPISKMGDAEIQEMAVKIAHHLTSSPAVKPRHWGWRGSAYEQKRYAQKVVESTRQQLQRHARWVLSVRDEMHNLGKEVKIFPRQCEYLLQRSMGASKELYDLVNGTIATVWDNDEDDYYLEPLLKSLGRLRTCTEAARELLQLCGNCNKEHEVALTLSFRLLPSTTNSHVSKFALVIRDLEWSLDAFYFLMYNPEAQLAISDSERQSWLSKFLWCESRGRLVYVGVSDNKDIVESSTIAIDNNRQAQDQQDLDLAMESHFITFQKPRTNVYSLSSFQVSGKKKKLSSSEMVSYMSILRNRLHGDASIDGNSSIRTIPSCFRIPGKQEYKAIHLLGKGSYKEVHKCKWLGMNVAIATESKRKGRSIQGGGDSIIFEAEAGLLARVQHPNVVTFIGYGYDEENQRGFQVSEIMESSLRSLLNKSFRSSYPFSVSHLIDLLLQIVEAMIHVHECGVIYRDLKADNCLANRKFDGYGSVVAVVKLTDFGTSELQSPKKGCHFNTPNKGSRRWMAPELYQRPGEKLNLYTWSADVYSFGMTCYEVVTGEVPFGINLFSIWLQEEVRKGLRPTIPNNCPDELRELMTKCWAHSPEDRPTFKEIREILWRSKLNHAIFYFGPDGKFTEPVNEWKKRCSRGFASLLRSLLSTHVAPGADILARHKL